MERTATIIAPGIGGFPTIVEAVRTTDERGVRRLSPFTVPSFLVNLAPDGRDPPRLQGPARRAGHSMCRRRPYISAMRHA